MKGDTKFGLGVCRMSFNLKEKCMFLLTSERSVQCLAVSTADIPKLEEGQMIAGNHLVGCRKTGIQARELDETSEEDVLQNASSRP